MGPEEDRVAFAEERPKEDVFYCIVCIYCSWTFTSITSIFVAVAIAAKRSVIARSWSLAGPKAKDIFHYVALAFYAWLQLACNATYHILLGLISSSPIVKSALLI